MVHSYVPQMQGGGIEALTIAFDHSPVGPHFTDRGYNAIQLTGAPGAGQKLQICFECLPPCWQQLPVLAAGWRRPDRQASSACTSWGRLSVAEGCH